MENKFCAIFIELKLKELLSKREIEMEKNEAFEFWEIIKELAKIKIKDREGVFVADSYVFECSLSEKDNLYYLILTRIFNVSWRLDGFLRRGFTEYFHFIFTYLPNDEYMNFKGQLYSQDFPSLTQFFDTIEAKDIFKYHRNFCKPVNVSYLVDDKLITNFNSF